MLILFTQASVAGAMVHTAPDADCGPDVVTAADHSDSASGLHGACQAADSQMADHGQHGMNGSDQADCCLDCECSLSHCSTSAAIPHDGHQAWSWATGQTMHSLNLPLDPALSSLFRPPILG